MDSSLDFGYLLNKAARLAKGRVNQKLSEIGLTFSQFMLIKYLYKIESDSESSASSTPASIADGLGYDRPTVTGIIDRMEKQVLAVREASLTDRRSQTIRLTEKAKALMEDVDLCFTEVNGMILTGFDRAEQRQLQEFLFRIMENLGEVPDKYLQV